MDPHADVDLPERYAAGILDPMEAAAFEDHLLVCERCQMEVRLAVGVRQVVRHAPMSPARLFVSASGWRVLWVALPVAAAAAIALFVARPHTIENPPAHRESSISLTPVPLPIAPVGRVTSWNTLVWSSVAGADQYAATIFDGDGGAIWEMRTTDTAVSVPTSVRLMTGLPYYWKVEARIGWKRSVASPLTEFIPSGARLGR